MAGRHAGQARGVFDFLYNGNPTSDKAEHTEAVGEENEGSTVRRLHCGAGIAMLCHQPFGSFANQELLEAQTK